MREGWMVTHISTHNPVLREDSGLLGEAARAHDRSLCPQGHGDSTSSRQALGRSRLQSPLPEGGRSRGKVPCNPSLFRAAAEVADEPCNAAGISGWCDWIN